MTFANPSYFFLLLLLVPYILWHLLWRRRQEVPLVVATAEEFRDAPVSLRQRLVRLPFFLRIVSFVLLTVILARPQTSHSLRESETEGVDIILAMDISTSMLTDDVRPDRIRAAKDVATRFINNRPNDNIGLTLFGGEAFTQCPLTTDHALLLGMFGNISCEWQANGTIQPGTAIGMGIANAVSHLKDSKAKSKVVILLTDGENNAGEISPLMAADLAKRYKVRVYTILLGTDGKVNVPVAQLPNGEVYQAQMQATADPTTLQRIARETGGVFYKAQSRGSLQKVYDDIDRLEKTKLRQSTHSRRYEAYEPFAWALAGTLLLELLLSLTWLRRNP